MNKTKIEWTDFTWNPVTGCLHGCSYCYARGISKRFFGGDFEPKFHPDRLEEPLKRKTPAKIFTVDMGDLFGEWVPTEWICRILAIVREAPWHTFQFLTKNPERMLDFAFSDNAWCGASITSGDDAARVGIIRKQHTAAVRFLSIEPLHGPIVTDLSGIDWIIIGAQTKPEVQPDKRWVTDILENTDAPIFLKDNLVWDSQRKEYPELGSE